MISYCSLDCLFSPLVNDLSPLLVKFMLVRFNIYIEHLLLERMVYIQDIESMTLLRFRPYVDDRFKCFRLYRPTNEGSNYLAPFGDMFTLTSDNFYNTLHCVISPTNTYID